MGVGARTLPEAALPSSSEPHAAQRPTAAELPL